MAARSTSSMVVALFVAAACNPAAPALTPPTVAPSERAPYQTHGPAAPTSAATSTAPTRTGPPATPKPPPSVDVVTNPDGSTFIGLPGTFGFAQPGQPAEGGIWGIHQVPDFVRDVVRIDARTFETTVLVADLRVLPNPIHGVAVDGSFWLSSWDKSAVDQYAIDTGELVRSIPVGDHPIEPVFAYGAIWTLDHHGDSVTRIDAATGEGQTLWMPESLPLRLTPVADDLLLVNGASPRTYMVDPERMEALGTYELAGCFETHAGWFATAIDGYLWRQRCNADEVAILDPRTGALVDTFPSPVDPSIAPLVVDGIWWFPTTTRYEADTPFSLAGLDPESRKIVGTWTATTRLTEGWAFAAFDAWWRWGKEGLLRIPADILRASVQ
jgi:hypothetical protein